MSFIIILLFSSIPGILLCRLIILKQLKKKNSFVDSLCKTEGNFDCDAVLESSVSKLSNTIYLGDVGLFYFLGQFLFLIFSLINNVNNCINLLLIPMTCSFLGTFILLGYQWKVIKNWCKLCLLLTSIIWMQEILVLIFSLVIKSEMMSSYLVELCSTQTAHSFFTGITCLAISATWFFIKPVVTKANEIGNNRKQMATWKNSIQLFSSILKSQKKIDPQMWEDDFILGNKDASVKLITALNPYCSACAREYKRLVDLLTIHNDVICVVIRFGVNLAKPSIKTKVLQLLIHSYDTTPKEAQINILTNWFSKPEFKTLETKYPNFIPEDTRLLKKYENWFKDADIKYTPTIFLNGYEFPTQYRLTDLKILIPKLLKRIIEEPLNKMNKKISYN